MFCSYLQIAYEIFVPSWPPKSADFGDISYVLFDRGVSWYLKLKCWCFDMEYEIMQLIKYFQKVGKSTEYFIEVLL